MTNYYPRRIVCLTDETTETLYLLGEEDRIAGISGFTRRPPRARKEKPRVSTFTSADTEKILELDPDLVLGFSDLQADMAAELIKEGIAVHIFNQRTVEEILGMVLTLGAMVGRRERAGEWVEKMEKRLDAHRDETAGSARRPTVYFEEWNDPLITGIRWVSELIRIAGGEDCFPDLSDNKLARDRIIAEPGEIVKRDPDIIIASWCGASFDREELVSRKGWDNISAVKNEQIFEIDSSDILQPGPAALTDGLDRLSGIIANWKNNQGN